MSLDVFIVLAILALTLLAFLSRSKNGKRPPGPWSFPIVGHLPMLGDQPARKLLEWKKTYGPIISVTFGSHPAVVINDATLIKTAFSLPAFAGRPHVKFLDDVTQGRKGFMFADGPNSSDQRQFLKRNLKDFGYGTRTMESVVLDQVSLLLPKLEQNVGKSLTVKSLFNGYTVNSLWSIVSGEPLDPESKQTKELASAVTRASAFPGVIDKLSLFMPQLGTWFPNWSGHNMRVQCGLDVQSFMIKLIDQTKSSRVRNQPRMVLDACLDKIDETVDPQSPFHSNSGNLVLAMQDLFAAGVETTSTAMEWTFLYLAKFPQVQTKLQQEIDNKIGSARLPALADRQQLPYAEAVTNEILRISTILQLALFHRTLENVELNGYFIPKHTMVIGNLHAAHNDPEIWGDPEIFRPERFLDKEGKIVKNPNFIPFSWGKRNCVGEHLALLQLFLFTVSIYQRFEIRAIGTLPPFEGNFGISTSPDPFQVSVKRRTGI